MTNGEFEHSQKAHGDAWKYFRESPQGQSITTDEIRKAWKWFLTGWLAKAKQREDLIRDAWNKR